MSKNSSFVLPAGVEIDLSGEVLSVGFEGDVHLEQSLGRSLGDVYAGGDLFVKLPTITGSLRSGGKMVLEGRVDADSLHGREIHLGRHDVKARAITADVRIWIGAAKLQVDVIMAPEIVLDAKASGRVTILESHNDTGSSKIKGGFSVTEYEEAIGDPHAYLAERGLKALPPSSETRLVEAQEAPDDDDSEEDPEIDRTRSLAVDAYRGGSASAPVQTPAPAAPRAKGADPVDRGKAGTKGGAPSAVAAITMTPAALAASALPEEDVDDPLSLSVDDLEPVADFDAGSEEEALHLKLTDAVQRIAACYEGKETPPAVLQLRDLVEARDYDKLREHITDVWNGLLGFHQKKGIRPHHQVTHAFNVIHGLVQQT
jgi:hypothetical protein